MKRTHTGVSDRRALERSGVTGYRSKLFIDLALHPGAVLAGKE
jgi:hypothetical protein